jgi:predicted permease
MTVFLNQLALAAPLFLLVVAGFAVVKVFRLKPVVSKRLTSVVFTVALPLLLFHLMSGFPDLPPADPRVLVAFFGGCLLVFGAGLVWGRGLGLGRQERPVFAIGGVFSNNVMLGLPLAQMVLGPGSVPTVALVLVFNALILWTLVTVAVEWSRQGSFSAGGLVKTMARVAVNPLIIGIAAGVVWGVSGLKMPVAVGVPLAWVGQAAGPLALLALGMGMAHYQLGQERRVTAGIVVLKLVLQPLVVWGLALLVGLGPVERRAVVLLASCAVGSNVYLMARQFGVVEVPVSQALLVSTLLSAVTTPLFLSL